MLGYIPPLNNWMHTVETNNEVAEDRITKAEQWRQLAKEVINKQVKGPPQVIFKKGEKVWLEGKNLTLSYVTAKLAPKQFRPFTIIKEVSPIAYQLELPTQWKIHNVFHASLLSTYQETEQKGPLAMPPPLDIVEGEPEYKVEAIINHRYHGPQKKLQYLIR